MRGHDAYSIEVSGMGLSCPNYGKRTGRPKIPHEVNYEYDTD